MKIPEEIYDINRIIYLKIRPPPVRIDPTEQSTVVLKSPSKRNNQNKDFGEVEIPPGSIFQSDGTIYTNEVNLIAFLFLK